MPETVPDSTASLVILGIAAPQSLHERPRGGAHSVAGLGGGYQVMLMPNSAEMPEQFRLEVGNMHKSRRAVSIALQKY